MAKFKLKKTQQVGSPDAETDDFILSAFIQIENYDEILDVKNQKSILLGRTGTGKSALIKFLKNEVKNISEIQPESLSLRFLSNSTILRYFSSLGVHLNLFYKVLWKHVFIVELLKMYFDEDSNSFKKQSFFERLKNNLNSEGKRKSERKEQAIRYMETWSNDFWKNTEILIKSFEKNIQEKFEESIGMNFEGLKFGMSGEKYQTDNFKFEAKQKAESIISNSQVVELLDIIEIMKEDLFISTQKKYYLVIDDLDKEWIEDSIRLELIGALVDIIKEFRQLTGVKIIISLRENLNELIYLNHEHKGNQREKLKPLYSNLTWTDDELKDLIDKRLKLLSANEFSITEAFYANRRGDKKGFEYILDRTYRRPRDVISFMNHIIENASSKSTFTNDIISRAEPSYSLERFQALEDEWFENYGKISIVCDFLKGQINGFRLKTINENLFTDLYCDESAPDQLRGELKMALLDWRSNSINYISFQKKLMFILYRIGILGVKKAPVFPTAFYYSKEILIDKSDISNGCRFYIHPSLYSHFKINVIDQLPEEDN